MDTSINRVVLVLQSSEEHVFRGGGAFSIKDVDLLAYHFKKQWNGNGVLEMYCLYDRVKKPFKLANGVTLLPMFEQYPKWWAKINMFHPAMEQYRPFLFVDLDTLILGDLKGVLPPIDEAVNKFITIGTFTESIELVPPITNPIKKELHSGIMWVPAKNEQVDKIWKSWISDPKGNMKRYFGDQDFIKGTIGRSQAAWQEVTNKIGDFKPSTAEIVVDTKEGWKEHIRRKIDHFSVICLHGKPKMESAAEHICWIQDYMDECFDTCFSYLGVHKAYVINLEERKDRLETFYKQQFPFSITRFPALKAERGIMGCNVSHKVILQDAKEFPILVFEDDCKIIGDWNNVKEAISQLPSDWDILYLGANLNTPLQKVSANLFRLKKAWTTHAIIYGTQRVADYIIKNMPKDTTPIDVFYSDDIQENFNCYIVSPLTAIQAAGFSDIVKHVSNYESLLVNNFIKNTQ